MNPPPPPLPAPCEKCAGGFINEDLALRCRICGRRWHPDCAGGVKLCPHCTSPLQPAGTILFHAENRIERRRAAWLTIPASCTGAWALVLANLVISLFHVRVLRHGKPWFFEPWWIVVTGSLAIVSAVFWIRFFQRRSLRAGIKATASGIAVALLVALAGTRDAPGSERLALSLGFVSASLFASTAAAAMRWFSMPNR
jgi:hypothetical protein